MIEISATPMFGEYRRAEVARLNPTSSMRESELLHAILGRAASPLAAGHPSHPSDPSVAEERAIARFWAKRRAS
jgi:hypothetical protein